MTMECPFKTRTLALAMLLVSACGANKKPAATIDSPPLEDPASHAAGPVYDFDALARTVRADLEAYSGKDLSDLDFVMTDRDTMAKVLGGNLRAPMAQDNPLEINEAMVHVYAAALTGIFDYADSKKVYACPTNLINNSGKLFMPELKEPDVLYAVLVHEGVHALADRTQGLGDFFTQAFRKGEDAKMAADAVVEGYAQHVAREICGRSGKQKGFDDFTRSISKLPPIADPSERAVWELQLKQTTFSYIEGEQFVQAVLKELGPSGVDRIFQNPPASRLEIARPGWYLHPDQRPKISIQWEPALELVPGYAKVFPNMTFQMRGLSGPEIANALSILGPAESGAVADSVQECRMTVGMTPGGEQVFVVGLFAMESESSAARYLELSNKASDLKDETLKSQGTAQITASNRAEVHGALGDGFDSTKTVRFQGRELPVRTIMVARGSTVLEITLSNAVLPDSSLMDMANQVMDRALGAPTPLK